MTLKTVWMKHFKFSTKLKNCLNHSDLDLSLFDITPTVNSDKVVILMIQCTYTRLTLNTLGVDEQFDTTCPIKTGIARACAD